MKCPKCSYVSHDYLDACRKCNIDLVNFKAQMHLQAIKPGVLDLSLVLSGDPVSATQAAYARGHDDLFGSQMLVESEESDDTFDISLDDDVGMTPTQIEQLRTVRPGDDSEATEILPPAMAALGFQEARSDAKPPTSDQTKPGGAAPAQTDPPGPPKTGYATVMIDLDDMQEMLDDSSQANADQKDAGTVLPPTAQEPLELALSALDHEELSLTVPEAEETSPVTKAAADIDAADEMTLIEEVRPISVTAKPALELGGLNAEDDIAAAELTEMSLEVHDVAEREGEPAAESEVDFAELTEMSLEIQDAEDMGDDQATVLESALEMPSLDLDAEFTAEEFFPDALDTEEPAQPLLDHRDEDAEDLRLEFDDLELEDDDKPFA